MDGGMLSQDEINALLSGMDLSDPPADASSDTAASAADSGDCPASAVMARSGMGPMVDAAESGRKLFNASCRMWRGTRWEK